MAICFSQLGIFEQLPSKVFLEEERLTLADVLKRLSERYAIDLDTILVNGERLHPQLAILVNGVSMERLRGLDTIILDGDRVLLVGVVHGG